MRRPGRRAGGSSARDDILTAARELFSSRGLDRTTMRAVADEAGVDAALINHYFGSKRGLFLTAVELPVDPAEVLAPLRACPEDEMAATALRAILTVWSSPAGPAIVARLRQAIAADEPELIRGLLAGVILPIISERLGDRDDLDLRLGLFASQVAGLLLTRHVIKLPAMAAADAEQVVDDVAPVLQHYLTGDLG